MLIVLSPAKTLDMESKIPAIETTKPDFLTQSRKLDNDMKFLFDELSAAKRKPEAPKVQEPI